MKQLLASCAIAFSTYSRLPMPQVEWSGENMRYTLSFFPLVGAVIGLVFWLVDVAAYQLGCGMALRAALLTAVPAAVTGGRGGLHRRSRGGQDRLHPGAGPGAGDL